MKNLKAQFKIIIYLFLLLNIFSITLAKNLDKFSESKDISNYFSGILSIHDNQYEKSYFYLKSLNNLEDSHYNYSQYYQYSLIALNKFKEATNYSKKLENKKLDNFESNLISAVYYLKNKDLKRAVFYSKKAASKSQPNSIQNLISVSLNSWLNLQDITDLNAALNTLDVIPEKFQNIKNIQNFFVYCHYDSASVDEMFKKLTFNPDIDYSRYYFFYSNYLISRNNKIKAGEILESSIVQYPRNLMLKQLKVDIEKKNIFKNNFNCKNITNIIAEIFFISSNAAASQNNYITSNFYISLAKYLNSNFISYETRYAENFFNIQEYKEAKKIYKKIKKNGSVYSWYASQKIASIFIKQGQKRNALNILKKSFEEIINPTTYEIFDYAEFLKNNERYEESIRYYSKILNLIDPEDTLYAQVMNGRGVAYERTNQWKKAEIDLLNALKARPDDAYVINYLAYSWIEKGINIEKSLKMLKKANKLRPNDGYIIDSLGWTLFKLKNYQEAKKYLEVAIRYMAADPVVNDHYADALWMNNKSLQARYYWNYVLKLEKTEEKLKKEIKKKLLFGLKS